MMVLGHMRSSGGLTWDLTGDDALWLGRSIWGEGIGDAAHVGSTMLRRLGYVSDARGERVWESLSELLLAYSQPIAIQWRERGSAAQIARRERARSLEWLELPASVRQTVMDLLTGRRRFTMRGAVHFADSRQSARFLAANPGSRVVGRNLNTFISMPGSARYRDPVITAAAGVPPRSSGSGPLALAAGAAIGLVLL